MCKGHSSFGSHPSVCHLLAVGEVTTVAAGEVARKGITAGTTRGRGEYWGTRSNVVLALEAAIKEVDAEEGVIGTDATWDFDALGLWERGAAIAGNEEVGAHGVELAAVYQYDILECK